ncbi:MAG: ABC transporter permease, partial [Spirochaetaceae bacterium]
LVFGGVQYETFEVRIYSDINVRLDFVSAALYAAVQLLFTGALFLLSGRLIRGGSALQAEVTDPERRLSDAPPLSRTLATVYGVGLLLFFMGPILTLLWRSVSADGGLSLNAYFALFGGETERNVESILRATIPEVIIQSLLLAFASGTLTFVLAMSLAWVLRRNRGASGGVLSTIAQLPLGISLVTVALGVRLLYIEILPLPLLVIVTQAIATLPLVYRIVSTETQRLRESYVEGARSLGAGTPRIIREIALPVLRRGLLNAYAYALALPFADLTAVLTVGRGEISTFPVAIYRLIGFRSFDLALALSGFYLVICFLLFLWIDRTSFRRETGGTI